MLIRTDWSKKKGKDYLNITQDGSHTPGFHPKCKDVNLAAESGRLQRFPAAQEWLDGRTTTLAKAATSTLGPEARVVRAQAAQVAPNNSLEQERLFKEFLEWRRNRP